MYFGEGGKGCVRVKLNSMVPLTLGCEGDIEPDIDFGVFKGCEGDIEPNGAIDFGASKGA